jgi:O-acetyl-ADP-ribose deacetylase (regulator of RNase III)
MANEKPDCFVIMPFGEKIDVSGTIVDFDEVFRRVIAPAAEAAGLDPKRSIDVLEAGLVHRKMIEHIRDSPAAIVDTSMLNPNVFYELGVRHTLRHFVTVLIRRSGTSIPFNIGGMSIIEYDDSTDVGVEKALQEIVAYLRNGMSKRIEDSLVHEVIDVTVSSPAKPFGRLEEHRYPIRETGKVVGLITGDIRHVKGRRAVDVWVNAENTNMQMARFYDWSVSSVIRLLGARRDQKGKVVEDTIANELARIMDGDATVDPGTVIATTPGMLAQSHGVKAILHAACVSGELGRGYRPIDDLARCVFNALEKVDASDIRALGARSVLFPLLGAGVAPNELPRIARELFEASLNYLHDTPDTAIERVCFLVFTEGELSVCRSLLAAMELGAPTVS